MSLRATRIDESLSVRDGHIFVEGCDTVELAGRFGTPMYVLSEDQLRRNARRFVRAFGERWPEGPVRILPSLKANFVLAARRVLTQEGLGCDTFGASELDAALRAGVAPELISVNGSIKDAALIHRAVGAGTRITVDAARELELVESSARRLGTTAHVRFRLRPDYLDLLQPTDFLDEEVSVREAAHAYKAGIPADDVVDLGRRALSSDAVDLVGVHAHLPRHRREVDVWRGMVRAFVSLVGELSDAWGGWRPREIDLGGGYATPRDPTGQLLPRLAVSHGRGAVPTVEEYAEVVTTSLREELTTRGLDPAGVALEVEPGRAMYADAGLHLATVRNVKRETRPTHRRWIETDTTEMFLPDSLIEHNRWTVLLASQADAAADDRADVVGMSCGFDCMVPEVELPAVSEGDVVAFLDTGAYQDASSSNFNALPRPATVLVHGDEAEMVKRAESIEDVFARDVVPDRLRVPA
jgi:diaminopimelate decarboxylase